ncbi:MAG: 50S ribosomal protein L28 [Alphaproteobacteria bacterium]|jgi:large subunit ribosomal protein L28|nr:50S ribosomal protein L28 [Alphaproteobacteria bacterium]MCV6599031.1 50S ribosomal protein L28 [Alphaproteobacteria bacterium]
MAKVCPITGKKVISGRTISITRSQISGRTKRKFNVNLQKTSFYSEAMDKMIKLRVTAAGIRTVEKKGGIDAYLLGMDNNKLDSSLKKIKKNVEKAIARKSA